MTMSTSAAPPAYGGPGLRRLERAPVGARRKAHDRGDDDRAPGQLTGGDGDHGRGDAHRRHRQGARFPTEDNDVGLGRLGSEQGVVDAGGDLPAGWSAHGDDGNRNGDPLKLIMFC
jgi:hypothetical protein